MSIFTYVQLLLKFISIYYVINCVCERIVREDSSLGCFYKHPIAPKIIIQRSYYFVSVNPTEI